MSRISNRLTTIAASLAIILLILLLIILWTGTRNSKVTTALDSLDNDAADRREDFNGTSSSSNFYGVVPFEPRQHDNLSNEVTSSSSSPEQKTRPGDLPLEIPVSSRGDLEFIRPIKISQNQYEDPLDEFTGAKRHHTGHFRHSKAEIWDPHPQYEFTAFGKQFRLRLALDSSFVSPDIKVTHVRENTTRREHPGKQLGCFYTGSIDGDPNSVVSVSLCHGMTGHMKTSTGSYFIKPAEQWKENDKTSVGSTLKHAIYRVATKHYNDGNSIDDGPNEPGNHNCGVIDYINETPVPLIDDISAGRIYVGDQSQRHRRSLQKEEDEKEEDEDEFDTRTRNHVNQNPNQRHSRSLEEDEFDTDSWRLRRAVPKEYFIEIMVVADAKMIEYHGSGLVSYILVLMSTVSRIYKDSSIGNPISIAVTKIVETDEVFGTRHTGSDGISAAEMLKRFCHWQKRKNPDEPSWVHHDTALLLTRENLCHNPAQKRCDTLGLAELGRMCIPAASCAIVQDNGLAAAFTIAHEIGHVLNMPHDDDSKCSIFRNRTGLHNVMSRMLDDNTFPWEWSKCSRHYVTEFLEAGNAHCLLDEPIKTVERFNFSRLPGEDYSENRQCELVFGPGSKICPDMISDVCKRLWCTAPMWDRKGRQQCHTQHMPWADGTACGVDKWCHRGECVSRRNLQPIDGQWGEWGRYGECSRTCGGGIKKKYRECDSPPPQNGGNYCSGERVKYRSCGTKECPPGTPDFREEQCSMFDNNNLNIQNLGKDVKWRAKYTRILPEDRCKLFCQVQSNQYYMLRDKVTDGTPCGPDTFHICVNGHCKPAGCDHVLNSTAELDTCGVCRGDNSTCQRISGSYNLTNYGYNKVVKFPAGSSYIDVQQFGWGGSQNDSNYLVLRIGEHGKYILNGNFMVMHRKVILHPGITIEYSGPEAVVERLNSSRPIGVDLVLEVLSVGDVYPPQIKYEYTVPKRILGRYAWSLSDWSKCNRVCQGVKYRRAECMSTESADVVSNDYCRSEEKPMEENQSCNTHCSLQWQVTSISECSSHCGPGSRTLTFRCVQILHSPQRNSTPHAVSSHACYHLERPSEVEECTGPCDEAHWTYSDWSSCSVTCGGGVQTRTATCVDSNQMSVSDDRCHRQEKHLTKLCSQETCPKWDLGEWTPCSVTCGIGKRERPYWCQIENRVVSAAYCSGSPNVTESCDMGPCDHWETSEWTPCSVTCGEGTQRRKVLCERQDGSMGQNCKISEKPLDIRTCSLPACPILTKLPKYAPDPPYGIETQHENEIDGFRSGYEWRTGNYGECSKSCNGGFTSRVVRCASIETGVIAPDNYCDNYKRPRILIPCNRHACPVWKTGEWSQCNVKCGNGYQHRQVRCQTARGEVLPDSDCTLEGKPLHAQRCQKPPCDRTHDTLASENIGHRWRVSNWTPCSKSCGSGIKKRKVECIVRTGNRASEVPVKDERCSRLGLVKPKSQRPCQRFSCDYFWQEGTWSECSADCGNGIQRRAVTCHRVNRFGWIDPTPVEGCPIHEKPVQEQTCKLRECDDQFYWTTGPWKKCSHSCGKKGKQIRRLFCHNRLGKKVARVNCPIDLKPQRKRKCNQRRCVPLTCSEAQKRLRANKDGEYSLLVGGKSMTIYCHGMSTDNPKEYLTLPSGQEDNYSEIYDKRLLNPEECPYEGQRNDSCSCATGLGTVSGKTMFKRVRLDPVKLRIIADDYTFSWTKGAKRVEYGKAGDCYSLKDCPQGRFSINLSGTLLTLSPNVTWVAEKSRANLDVHRINNQRIVGKCGGYCGFCAPKSDLKLDVLPP